MERMWRVERGSGEGRSMVGWGMESREEHSGVGGWEKNMVWWGGSVGGKGTW